MIEILKIIGILFATAIIIMTPTMILSHLVETIINKKCPYCQKNIPKKAIKCPHCQSDLK